jgi:hypothetical protein
VFILAVPLVALLAFYIASPRWAVRSLRSAAQEHDGSAIAEALDLPSIQASLKEQCKRLLLAAETRAPRAGTGAAVIGRVGPSIAQSLVDPLIDRVLTPEGIADFVQSDAEPARELLEMVHGPRRPSDEPAVAAPADPWVDRIESMGFRSPIRFAVRMQDGWVVYLRPQGLGWKVYDVAVPAGFFEEAPVRGSS